MYYSNAKSFQNGFYKFFHFKGTVTLRSATRQLEPQCHTPQLGGLRVIAKIEARKKGIRHTRNRTHERKLGHVCESIPFEMNSLREDVVNRSNRNLTFI